MEDSNNNITEQTKEKAQGNGSKKPLFNSKWSTKQIIIAMLVLSAVVYSLLWYAAEYSKHKQKQLLFSYTAPVLLNGQQYYVEYLHLADGSMLWKLRTE